MSDLFDELASALRFERAAELRALLDADPYDEAAVEEFHSGLAAGKWNVGRGVNRSAPGTA